MRIRAIALFFLLVCALALLVACAPEPTATQSAAPSGDLLSDLSRAIKALFAK